jgi:hypothetical protein
MTKFWKVFQWVGIGAVIALCLLFAAFTTVPESNTPATVSAPSSGAFSNIR